MFWKGARSKKAWVRVAGLLYLWCREVLEKIGDGCEGFTVVDEDTTFLLGLQWAKI